ncbi:MAG TPA: tetratricopeptide repeat protein [Rhizomicrobium sp.]|jgi:predicted O-linked N-acetylglucosamine transferase (SPINDLY family)|nr:tetratricopeptide repeat protein [Rhizomicrobium sp.]
MTDTLPQGRRLLDAGFAAEALPFLERAERTAEAAHWLAEAQRLQQQDQGAQDTLDAALAAAPGHPALVVARSEMALAKGDTAQALALLGAGPADDADIMVQRARAQMAARDFRGALRTLRRAVVVAPDHSAAWSALIVAAAHDPHMDTARLKALQRRWRGPSPLAGSWTVLPKTRLRVGYVSRAFSHNNVAKVIAPAILHHDPERIETYLYSTSRVRDAGSVRFREAAAQWRPIAGLSDAEAVMQIRRDRIDILVDIDGHYFANRLGIFALRGAPVQVSAWGYVPGPGVPGIDWLLTDHVIAPADEATLFRERLMPLTQAQPYDGLFRPRPDAAARPHGAIRFGCFHRSEKLNDAVLELWARILAACPGATLTLKSKYFGTEAMRGPVRAAFGAIDPARLLFEGDEPHAAYLKAFDRIDVALDPFPVNGGLVTLDGLSQGVPAITLAGVAPPGRIGASILRAVGLERFVCASEADYLARAIELARNAEGLDALRDEVRERAAKTFRDSRAYAADVEDAYREIWSQAL